MDVVIKVLVGITILGIVVSVLQGGWFVVMLIGGIIEKVTSSLSDQHEQTQNQWKEAASELDLQFQPGQEGLPGGSPVGLTLEGTHRGREIIAYTDPEDTGEVFTPPGSSASLQPVFRIVQRYVIKLGADLPGELVLTADADMSGEDRVESNEFYIGDAGFDEAYVKSAHDQEEATAVLSRRQLRSALAALADQFERVQLSDGFLDVKSDEVTESKDELRQNLDRLVDIAEMLDHEAADAAGASSSGDEAVW